MAFTTICVTKKTGAKFRKALAKMARKEKKKIENSDFLDYLLQLHEQFGGGKHDKN